MRQHEKKKKALERKLAKMVAASQSKQQGEADKQPPEPDLSDTPEELAEDQAVATRFVADLSLGNGPEPAMTSVEESLMQNSGICFRAADFSKMLHYVAERLLPIYLELARQVANADIRW